MSSLYNYYNIKQAGLFDWMNKTTDPKYQATQEQVDFAKKDPEAFRRGMEAQSRLPTKAIDNYIKETGFGTAMNQYHNLSPEQKKQLISDVSNGQTNADVDRISGFAQEDMMKRRQGMMNTMIKRYERKYGKGSWQQDAVNNSQRQAEFVAAYNKKVQRKLDGDSVNNPEYRAYAENLKKKRYEDIHGEGTYDKAKVNNTENYKGFIRTYNDNYGGPSKGVFWRNEDKYRKNVGWVDRSVAGKVHQAITNPETGYDAQLKDLAQQGRLKLLYGAKPTWSDAGRYGRTFISDDWEGQLKGYLGKLLGYLPFYTPKSYKDLTNLKQLELLNTLHGYNPRAAINPNIKPVDLTSY